MTSATDRGKGHHGNNHSHATQAAISSGDQQPQQHHHHHHHRQSTAQPHQHAKNKDHHHHPYGVETSETATGSPTASTASSSSASPTSSTSSSGTASLWHTKKSPAVHSPAAHSHRSSGAHRNARCSRHQQTHRSSKTESVLSTDSDIRFTRRKLGDSQRCGCALIAGFLLLLLLASLAIYVGYTFLRPDPLPERIFRAKLRVTDGDSWTPELADQNSLRFQHKQRDYRERINLIVRRSDLRDAFDGSEVLALDGSDDQSDLTVHVNLHFDPYRALVSAADLTAIFLAEITAPREQRRHFGNLTVDPFSLHIAEVRSNGDPMNGSDALSGTAYAVRPAGDATDRSSTEPDTDAAATPDRLPRVCQPLGLPYCASIGYNATVYPNHMGHEDLAAVNADLIAFRELVDAECFRYAFDFVCRLLQPPCMEHEPMEAQAQPLCREYCQAFWRGCGGRGLPERFRRYLDCERFPEADGAQSCWSRPGCAAELRVDAALSGRLCDGVADCADLSDEMQCAYCPAGSLYCGKGRACIAKEARCDGRVDCPDGSDERDCLSISPQVSFLTNPAPITPHRPRFYADGFAVFLEKGETGKLCAEGLDGRNDEPTRRTVAESLCKALGYENLEYTDVRNDTEPNTHYVKVLDPRAEEISFVRTVCPKKQALYVRCGRLECGISSSSAGTLPKMSTAGDWPWHVQLFRDDTHVCDGTLISADWVLTTESCFQGQPRATWMAVFGSIRRLSQAPWTQRRRIIGMVKSPVEGSTAALIRLETSVSFSNFIRPICLSDHHQQQQHQHRQQELLQLQTMDSNSISPNDRPHTERLTNAQQPTQRPAVEATRSDDAPPSAGEVNSNYFIVPPSSAAAIREFTANYTDDRAHSPLAYALQPSPFRPSPAVPDNHSQRYYETRQPAPPHVRQKYLEELRTSTVQPAITTLNDAPSTHRAADNAGDADATQWTNCQTLGWSRQRDHLQRVQLQIAGMAGCENVSIATVNSVCTKAVYQQQDCSEEEFAGSPMMCLLPAKATTSNGAQASAPPAQQWALVGVASWRIVCAQMGIERPRMYDKIASNAAWIRDTISAT